jgi:hypothetical protein
MLGTSRKDPPAGVKSTVRRFGTAVGTTALMGTLAAGCGASKSAGQAPPVTPQCAWPIATNAQTISQNPLLNISNPDTASDYWLMPFTNQDGLRITLSGQYPASRYASFAVYTSHGTPFTTDGVASTLTDFNIAPDRGSVNPWQHPAPPGGSFTVTLRADTAPGQLNTLPLAPAGTPLGTVGLLFLRIYASAQPNPGTISLPTVTFTANGASKRLSTCPATATPTGAAVQQVLQVLGLPASYVHSGLPMPAGPRVKPGAPGAIVPFAAYPAGSGRTVDTDIAYLSATVVPPQNGDVLVIRAKAPTTPSKSSPIPWPAPGEDMRYWSICDDLRPSPIPVVVNRLPDGTFDEGCRDDSQMTLDHDGYYSVVVGTETQRAAIERIAGATFLPFSAVDPTQTHKVNVRNMLPTSAYPYAIQGVPANGSPASAAKYMGPYYPRAAFCSLPTLINSGPQACLTGNK